MPRQKATPESFLAKLAPRPIQRHRAEDFRRQAAPRFGVQEKYGAHQRECTEFAYPEKDKESQVYIWPDAA